MTFAALFVSEKRDKRKNSPTIAGRRRRRPLQAKTQSIANRQSKKYVLYSVSAGI